MSREPNVYRIPPDPGFVGGYNWPAMVLGLLLLLVVNIGATQFIAHRFRYQPHSAAPLSDVPRRLRVPAFRVGDLGLQARWQHRTRGPAADAVRSLIVVAGSALTILVVYGLNLRRARRLSGERRGPAWVGEMGDRQRHPDRPGFSTPRRASTSAAGSDPGAKRLHYLRHNGPEHVLAFAPTRSGKGVGLVIPTLLAWSESAVIYDIKGENWARTAGFRASGPSLLQVLSG